MPSYKVFKSTEFVDRDAEFERVQTILKERSRGVVIFEGERGSGKTSLLFELYRRFHERIELRPFLISLFPYSAPEFELKKNIWIHSERAFENEDIPGLLDQLAHHLEIDFIESRDRDFQKEYLARGLAYSASKSIPVLLVDSIYECPKNIRVEIEKYVLVPLLTSEQVFIILSGRGRPPVWSRPELQNAEIISLPPLAENHIKEQLEKIDSDRVSEYRKVADLSGGYPLISRVIGESKRELPDALNEAIDIIIKDTLPETERKDEKYADVRLQIEKLSLVDIPFRITDIEDYLYPNDSEQRAKTNNLINLLLTSHILRYESKGYQLNQSIIYPIRKWMLLKQPSEYQPNLKQLERVSRKLQEDYPAAKTLYQRMLPPSQIKVQHST